VEQLEEANDSQLFTILHDLVDTAFFRNFAVDLETKCPLSWDRDRDRKTEMEPTTKETKKTEEEKTKTDDNTSNDNDNDNDNDNPYAEPEGGCASEGLPDADEEEEDSVPACHVDLGANDFMGGMGMGMGGGMSGLSGMSSAPPPPHSPPVEEQMDEPVEEKVEDVKVEIDEEEEEESEFDCDGGSISDEVEDDAPPLCQLTHSEMTTLGMGFDDHHSSSTSATTTTSKTPLQDLLSSALNSVNEKMGWESDSEEKTFIWNRSTNPVVRVRVGGDEEPCDDSAETGRLPDSFWIDMCSRISEGEGLQMVDLSLNPERNTGYNGTHIWQSIYEENCIDINMKNDIEMCYEERVLYRLLSGLHASTTLSIAMNYYPPNKKKNRLTWTPNPKFFWSKFGSHSGHPEYIRNLHFSYVVLLRALKKAEPILSRYEIRTGDIIEDETAMVLLRRLLNSSILKSCSNVFEAFDESLMFRGNITDADDSGVDGDGDAAIDTGTDPDLEQDPAFKFPNGRAQKHPEELITLQHNFKMVFHNISSILDCVQCQQCKLHGKMAMLGYGTALKILFMSDAGIEAAAANINIGTGVEGSLTRNEIVALINTVAKFSESLREVRELTHLYWSGDDHGDGGSTPTPGLPSPSLTSSPLDMAMGAVNALSTAGAIAPEREEELIHLALAGDEVLLTLAKHYGNDLEKFLAFSTDIGELGRVVVVDETPPDAIVIGTGLAGLTATLNILDRGGRVLVVEKEHNVGGNSNKASSGINACDNVTAVSITDNNNNSDDDYLGSFIGDTTKSAGNAARPELIEQLVGNSWEAVSWLKERVGVDLSLKAQLGGHQYKRTHRPKNGMVGAEIIYGVQKAVKEYEKQGKVKIMTDTKVVGLLRGEGRNVTGVQVQYLLDDAISEDRPTDLKSPHVILATGGFAADRSEGSLLSQYRPELISMPATAGPYSTGDGIGLATTVGAGVTDMDKVQVHPTGWVDPKDPHNPNKVLAGELMRGVGGILMNKLGKRFCNELGTRAYVTDEMLSHDPYHAEHGVWKKDSELQTFALVLSSSAAADGKKHVDHYIHKGLMTRLEGVTELTEWMGQDVDVEVIRNTLTQYCADAENGVDEWGKTSFQGTPDINFDTEIFYAGTVTPVLHYCMGGLTIDKDGNVLDDSTGLPISGLHAAGEVTGGVHGNNRLGGNSLLECTVYGTIVGKKIPIQPRALSIGNITKLSKIPIPKKEMAQISLSEVAKHNTEDDCWVAIHGKVYDLTDFAESHPPGAISIHKLAGIDGTEAFQSIHNEGMLEDFEDDLIGVLVG